MIAFIIGTVEHIDNGFAYVNVNDIGYRVYISSRTASELSMEKEKVRIYTYMSVKEDSVSLFGFLKRSELDMFNKLIGVSGVGPKGALAILSVADVEQLALAVMSGDEKLISSATGIGKKTAQRIVLELKDKLGTVPKPVSSTETISAFVPEMSVRNEAIEGLVALGFARTESAKAVDAVYTEGIDTSALLTRALKVVK